MAGGARVEASLTIGGTSRDLLWYALHERISEVASMRCAFGAPQGEDLPDPESLVDQPAVLTLQFAEGGGAKRYFAGKVVQARRGRSVEVLVVADAWALSRRADCRIFQQKSVVDIVKEVLSGADVTKTEWKTTGSYATRDYTVQYRETDLAFVARLLSEEGIYFVFRHDASANTMVFGDDPKGLGSIDGNSTLPYRDTFGEAAHGEYVADVERTQRVCSDKTTLRDYDPTKPKLKLESTAKADKASAEVYVWPGRFTDPKVGDRYAQVLLDSIRADRDVVTGRAGALTLVPGATFSIDGHPYGPLNQEYMIVAVDADGGGEGAFSHQSRETFFCRFQAVPKDTVAYRPPRLQRERFVYGTQTANTTGPSGQEIHTNEAGQVKAQFHWDRLGKDDDKSSCWMRTSQLPTGGSMLLPRMKWEVAVSYLEGDADRPFVMARMYNAVTMPPYKLPDHKGRSSIQTATTPGGGSVNEIRMSDDKGSEEMFMNASKDMSIDVGNNTTEDVKVNLTRQIGSNHELSITDSFTGSVGASQKVNVGGQQAVHVQTFMVDQVTGNHTLKIGGMRSMKVGGDHKRDVTGDSKLDVGSMSIDLVVGAANEHALGDAKHDVAAALVEMTAGSRSVIVGGDCAEAAGAAKVIVTAADRSVDVTGSMQAKVAGLVYRKTTGDLAETASGNVTEIAAGAQIIKADNISIEGQSMVMIVMGASTIMVMPSMVMIAGASMKVDGEIADEGALVLDN